jgi:hypothetical protein
VLALAVAVLALLATGARAHTGGTAPARRVPVGIGGGVAVPVATVDTKRERFGSLETVQYVPVPYGVLF